MSGTEKTGSSDTRTRDVFAEIASRREITRAKELIEPQPPKLPRKFLRPFSKGMAAAFKPGKKLETQTQLQAELERQRAKYERYMANHAPKVNSTREKILLLRFDWRVQEEADKGDFQGVVNGKLKWEKVSIPHYGPPLGKAVCYYRTVFKLTKAQIANKALFICFKGVDYKAHVFMNGSYLGSHEGFFAPFEFDFTACGRVGENMLTVQVENDAICLGNIFWSADDTKYEGDKLYAATGPGYDEPEYGWHHCPPGMGIYQDVFVETRSRVHINDVFVRPIPESAQAEAWIEIANCDILRAENLSLELSIFGQNFEKVVIRDHRYKVDYSGPGVNYERIRLSIPQAKIWDLTNPWLYQIQIKLLDAAGCTLDVQSKQFGMRSFSIDENSKPKGKFYFNGRELRLRGANEMGHLQQCVMKKDWRQLRDDILLAKICNMNFLRLTQRPVQPEIYEYCDKLGLLTQTDLPLFGVLRKNQFCEAVKQAQEMERLVRSHPCNVVISYINEPFVNSWEKPHRYVSREELEMFFEAANKAVLLVNPDRVIKPVDGDYCPPAPGLPDNHCYCGWYNGHGLDLGKLHHGYWQEVKPGWFYGCGEFGSEGLDFAQTMRRYYPKHWLPKTASEEINWNPNQITKAQTGNMHFMWFDTQHSLADWSRESQKHQAWITRLMTEAFRRDSRMNSFAIHLFVDAFPSGWMKTIMDFCRQPKPAYFAYREALGPLIVNLRTERYKYFAGEEVCLEAWICNDLPDGAANHYLHYQLEMDGHVLSAQRQEATIPACASRFQGFLKFAAPAVKERTSMTVRLGLLGKKGEVLHDTAVDIELFPELKPINGHRAVVVGSKNGTAWKLATEMGLEKISVEKIKLRDVILIDDYALYLKKQRPIMDAVRGGTTAIFCELPKGKYAIGNDDVDVEPCGMFPVHFASRNTGHALVKGFQSDDFKFWYDAATGYVTPILKASFRAANWTAILSSGNGDQVNWRRAWYPSLAAAEQKYGEGYIRICQIALAWRTRHNPAARILTVNQWTRL